MNKNNKLYLKMKNKQKIYFIIIIIYIIINKT